MEARGFQFVPDFLKHGLGFRLIHRLEQPIDRVHPEADRFHVKGGDSAPQGFGGFDKPSLVNSRQTVQRREQVIEFG